MSKVVIKIWDVENGKIQFGSNPSMMEMGENVLNEKKSSAEGVAMQIMRLLGVAEKGQGHLSLELFSKSEVTFEIEDKPMGGVSLTSNPNHAFFLQKERSGHKLTNAESVCVRVLRMLAHESKAERARESILIQ